MGCQASREEIPFNKRYLDKWLEITRTLQALKPRSKDLYQLHSQIQSSVEQELLTYKELESKKDKTFKKIIQLMEENENLSSYVNALKLKSNDSTEIASEEFDELSLEFNNTAREKLYYESGEEEIILYNALTISTYKINQHLLKSFSNWKFFSAKFPRLQKNEESAVVIVKKLKEFEEQSLLDINELIKKAKQKEQKNAKPLDLVYTFKFLEKLMDDKFGEDQKFIAEGKMPRDLSEFLIEKTFARYDTEDLGYKFLNQLVSALHNLYKMSQVYGILFCRLLNLYHEKPIPYRLAIYITQARVYFQQLKQLKPADETPGSPLKGFLEDSYGGESLLSDVIELVELLFKEDHICGAKILEKCRPSNIEEGEYFLYIICNKFYSANIDIDDWVENLEFGDTVHYSTFIKKLKKIDAFVDEEMIIKILDGVFTNNTIKKSDLCDLLDTEKYIDGYTNPRYFINKASFVNAIISVYDEIWIDKGAKIYTGFKSREDKNGLISERAFIEACFELELSIPRYEIENLYREAAAEDGITGDVAYSQVVKRLQYGAFNVFKMPDFENFANDTKERKTMMGDIRPSLSSISLSLSRLTV
ncbi:unnamed protein product [Blepharisma stoltei]|uniref:Uncharacterized protein n=1 Tax=Blepharisma stoltei TaxID=1481888 RepID=A0AAU9JK83_9CILI|nr:unnamed protein product [Blepharisma stoltei]